MNKPALVSATTVWEIIRDKLPSTELTSRQAKALGAMRKIAGSEGEVGIFASLEVVKADDVVAIFIHSAFEEGTRRAKMWLRLMIDRNGDVTMTSHRNGIPKLYKYAEVTSSVNAT